MRHIFPIQGQGGSPTLISSYLEDLIHSDMVKNIELVFRSILHRQRKSFKIYREFYVTKKPKTKLKGILIGIGLALLL